ncbi:MAG: RluA family pseudouridine synthase [Bacilli bacterium]|nr:RluA family pseudouridine synthase [Bacilli bacterium]
MEKYQNINILYEDNHLLVVNKPANMPVCLDSSNDIDLLSKLKEYLKIKYNKPGNVYLGLIHRLDRPVEGILVFAKTSKAASRLSKQITDNKFKKTYYAVIENKIENEGSFINYLTKDEKTNTSYVTSESNGKKSILEYKLIDYKDNLSLVKINLITGRHHQIRVQFSHNGYPLYGDHKYNKNFINDNKTNIALIAKELSFYHPTTNELLTFEIELPNKYPYTLF